MVLCPGYYSIASFESYDETTRTLNTRGHWGQRNDATAHHYQKGKVAGGGQAMRYGWEQRRRVPPPIHSSIYTYCSKVGVSVTHSKRRGKGRSVEGELKQRIIITEGASGRYFDSTLKAVPLSHSLASSFPCVVLCVSVLRENDAHSRQTSPTGALHSHSLFYINSCKLESIQIHLRWLTG